MKLTYVNGAAVQCCTVNAEDAGPIQIGGVRVNCFDFLCNLCNLSVCLSLCLSVCLVSRTPAKHELTRGETANF